MGKWRLGCSGGLLADYVSAKYIMGSYLFTEWISSLICQTTCYSDL
jgi:hypothetical protein